MMGKWLASAAFVLFVAGPANADTSGSEARAPAPMGPEAEAQDARAQVEAALLTMESLSTRLRVMLQRLRRERAAPAACVDEGLTRVNVALRQSREHGRLVAEAWQKAQPEEARTELRSVLTLRDNARKAANNVDYCFRK